MNEYQMNPLVTGTLQSWHYDFLNHVVWGYCYGDVKDRFNDGVYIHTSNLSMSRDKAKLLKEDDYVYTRNSIYRLGVKGVEQVNS